MITIKQVKTSKQDMFYRMNKDGKYERTTKADGLYLLNHKAAKFISSVYSKEVNRSTVIYQIEL